MKCQPMVQAEWALLCLLNRAQGEGKGTGSDSGTELWTCVSLPGLDQQNSCWYRWCFHVNGMRVPSGASSSVGTRLGQQISPLGKLEKGTPFSQQTLLFTKRSTWVSKNGLNFGQRGFSARYPCAVYNLHNRMLWSC